MTPFKPERKPQGYEEIAPYEPDPKYPCPRCYSPSPHLHPAMQSEGEVQPCPDPYHRIRTAMNAYYVQHEAGERVTRLLESILTQLSAVERRLAGVERMQDRTSKELQDDVEGIKADMDVIAGSVTTTIRDQQATITDLQVQVAALKAGQPVSQETLNNLVASTDAIKRSGDAIVELLTPAPAQQNTGSVDPAAGTTQPSDAASSGV